MATITITTTTEQDQRVIAAFTDRLGEPATGAMVKQWLIAQLKREVRGYELRLAREAADAGVTDIEPV